MDNQRLVQQLYQTFGYEHFRQGQQEIIEDVLAGRDVLGVLPTGTGKSICYQLPAKILPGLTIVVSPLISLMVDQVKQLKASGYKAVAALNSFMDRKDRTRIMENIASYDLIYVSPEMLQNEWVTHYLSNLAVDLFVVDEAHCISQWGHEFRTDYLKLHEVIRELGNPVVLALSATATPEVQEDIVGKLKCETMVRHIHPMDKQNISLAVEHFASPEQKVDRMINLLKKNQAPTMIYFSSRQWAERVSNELQHALEQRVAFYHGGMEQTDRMLVQQQFMNDQLDIICCTSAFGMGVDKKNIRFVLHFHIPSQLESFIQEIGRAGRDGEPCVSLVLYSPKDHYLPQMLIQSELPDQDQFLSVLSGLERYRKTGKSLPEDPEVLDLFELSESQWNFIQYQLDQMDVLKGKQLIRSPLAEDVRGFLEKLLMERWTYKHHKLNEMIGWIHCNGCRRVALYEPFQKGVREPDVLCCDACGFKIDQVKFNETSIKRKRDSWEKRLADLFGKGETS
ncbi:ATP-dependent DNA helicase RecQ [Halobacillus fulvus]|nr:ATP-dependent DNA helicase RecQ [Halobacillus fulvus]